MRPDRVTILSYQVGFGDCFLLSFRYPNEERHVLIDFGSTGLPDDVPKTRMKDIAADIAARVGRNGKLYVVATHRHKDHISGFATNARGNAPGDVIRKLKPRLVTQPWTEHPDLARDATGPAAPVAGARRAAVARVQTLMAMQQVAGQFLSEVKRNRSRDPRLGQIGFVGENNIANLSAVKNLMAMGPNEYVHFGSRTRLSRHLPGVDIDVLGPPTVQQYDKVKKQRHRDEDEFWHLMAAGGAAAETGADNRAGPLFPRFVVARENYRFPLDSRWLIQRARGLRTAQMLRIVRALDTALNNTSVILLFRVGGKSLLFPGDAQIENWEYALGQPEAVEKLKAVDLYKVGHHGSLNATPRTLWGHFEHRSTKKTDPDRLISMMSTMLGKHGDEDSDTEVPREKLTAALRRNSTHFTTQTLPVNRLFNEVVLDLGD
jgi:hypothetical protein